MYAALLHDVDDRKLFNTINYANARKLLDGEGFSLRKIIDFDLFLNLN